MNLEDGIGACRWRNRAASTLKGADLLDKLELAHHPRYSNVTDAKTKA